MRPVPRFSEDARQLVHVATGVAALLLRVASWWQAFDDGMATLVGRHTAGPRIPWNARSRWRGRRPSSCSAVLIAKSVA